MANRVEQWRRLAETLGGPVADLFGEFLAVRAQRDLVQENLQETQGKLLEQSVVLGAAHRAESLAQALWHSRREHQFMSDYWYLQAITHGDPELLRVAADRARRSELERSRVRGEQDKRTRETMRKLRAENQRLVRELDTAQRFLEQRKLNLSRAQEKLDEIQNLFEREAVVEVGRVMSILSRE